MTWLYDLALLATAIGAVFGAARLLVQGAGRRWVRVAGTCAVAVAVGWTLRPHYRGRMITFFQPCLLWVLMAAQETERERRLREQRAAEGAGRP